MHADTPDTPVSAWVRALRLYGYEYIPDQRGLEKFAGEHPELALNTDTIKDPFFAQRAGGLLEQEWRESA